MDKIIILGFILIGEYFLVIFSILADLYSGVSKAKKNNVIRSSYGFRRTVEKSSRYINLLIGLTIIDAIQISAFWYLSEFYGHQIPLFTFFTFIGSVGMSLIEVKSILEKSEDKVRFEEVGKLAGKIVVNRNDLEQIVKSVSEYMQTETNKDGSVLIQEKTKLNVTKKEVLNEN